MPPSSVMKAYSLFQQHAAPSAFQLKQTPRLLRSICPMNYRIGTIEYGEILVTLLYGKYCWRVYEVHNKKTYIHFTIYHMILIPSGGSMQRGFHGFHGTPSIEGLPSKILCAKRTTYSCMVKWEVLLAIFMFLASMKSESEPFPI